MPFGQKLLKEHGEFYPYAAVVTGKHEVCYVASHTGEEQPSSSEVLELLMQGLRQQARAEGIQAAGVCVNVTVLDPRTDQKTDALHFIYEHASGEAFDLFFPYKKRFLRGYRFAKPFAQPRETSIF